MIRRLALTWLCLNVASISYAEKNTELKPKTTKPGSTIVEDSFDATKLSDQFAAAKGRWMVKDGVLIGKELAADKHAAVLSLQHPNRDSVVRFSFLLDGTDGFHFSLNHAKGHLCRLIITKDSMTLRTDKDKKDPTSKSVLLGEAKGAIPEGEWHTLLVEIHGEQITAQLDNGLSVSGAHPSLDVDKPGYRFVTRGESLQIDDLKVWTIAN